MALNPKGTAIITGGAKRIGRALALRLADEGYDIALHYHHSEHDALKLIDEISKKGRKCKAYSCDLAISSDVEPLVNTIFSNFPNCNILINNASLFERFSLTETSEALFDKHFDVNFKAPFFLTKHFASHCKKGQVLNMLDSYALKHSSPYFAYLLSKKALHGFTLMAANELGPNIRVNGIALGLTELIEEEALDWIEKKKEQLPLREIPSITNITDTAIQLIHSDYLTGQILYPDGGEHLL